MVSNGMHYVQAALIGQFGEPASKLAPGRKRMVHVARRGRAAPLRAAAQDMGIDRANPDLYLGSRYNLDEVWQRAERDIAAFQALAEGIAATGVIPAKAFANVLVPYVAQIIARHPALSLGGTPSSLDPGAGDRDDALAARWALFCRLCDALLTKRRWLLVHSPAGQPFVTTDLGFQWVPGAGTGELFVPVNPDVAFVIRDDGITYESGQEFLDVPVPKWPDWQVLLRRDAMILTAPLDVYASSATLAGAAIAMWLADVPENEFVDGAPATAHALALVDSRAMAEAFATGAAADPRVAFARMLALQHQWGCRCDEALGQIDDPGTRSVACVAMHAALSVAEQSLRDEGVLAADHRPGFGRTPS